MTCIALVSPVGSVQVGVRQQREEARALDRLGELALIAGGGAGDGRRGDLAGLVDEGLQPVATLVVDPLALVGGAGAPVAPAAQAPLALAPLVLPDVPLCL